MDIVTVHNLKKYFGKGENQVRALDGIDLAIEKGKFTAIIGASGSGKTTLLNMIGGMDIPDEGEITVDGVSLRGLKEKELAVFRRSKVGFIYQNFNLIPTLTVRENILFPLSLSGSSPDVTFFTEIVQLLRVQDRLNAFPNELSGGGQQRVAIARALITKPSIILADEPTGNLDSKTGQNELGLLKLSVETYRQTLIMITHNLEIAQMADRVVRIEGTGASHATRGGTRMLANNNLKVCWTLVKRDFRLPSRPKNIPFHSSLRHAGHRPVHLCLFDGQLGAGRLFAQLPVHLRLHQPHPVYRPDRAPGGAALPARQRQEHGAAEHPRPGL